MPWCSLFATSHIVSFVIVVVFFEKVCERETLLLVYCIPGAGINKGPYSFAICWGVSVSFGTPYRNI